MLLAENSSDFQMLPSLENSEKIQIFHPHLNGLNDEFVAWNYEKSGNPVYLHIKETQKPVSEDRPSKKPTLLAIGVQGGFDNNDPEYEQSYEIVILPDYATLPFPSVDLPEKVNGTDLAVIRGGEVAITNLHSCNGPEFTVQLHFSIRPDSFSMACQTGAAAPCLHKYLQPSKQL